jgi:hypothetical protein
MPKKLKAGDEVRVLNDRALEDVKAGRKPYTLKTVKVHELVMDGKEVKGIKFLSGETRHEDGKVEPFYLTYTLDRIVED